MRLVDNIKSGFLKKKKTERAPRKVVIQKADQFLSVLLVTNSENEILLRSAATVFPNAELKSLFLRSKKVDESAVLRYSVHASDFNLTGLLKNDKLQKLFHTKFELVVDLSEGSQFLDYFLRGIESNLVIGRIGGANEELYDLLLEKGHNNDAFLLNMKQQLNLLTNGHHKI
jgi:hypothetical protein